MIKIYYLNAVFRDTGVRRAGYEGEFFKGTYFPVSIC